MAAAMGFVLMNDDDDDAVENDRVDFPNSTAVQQGLFDGSRP